MAIRNHTHVTEFGCGKFLIGGISGTFGHHGSTKFDSYAAIRSVPKHYTEFYRNNDQLTMRAHRCSKEGQGSMIYSKFQIGSTKTNNRQQQKVKTTISTMLNESIILWSVL